MSEVEELKGDLVRKSISDFYDKQQDAIISELERLSKEGHLLLVVTGPHFSNESENKMNVSGGVRLVLPKYDQALSRIAALEKQIDILNEEALSRIGINSLLEKENEELREGLQKYLKRGNDE